MASIPTSRNVAFNYVLVQWTIALLIILCYYLAGAKQPFVFGVITYFSIVLTIRQLFHKHHLRGIKLLKQGLFEEAIPHFEACYTYFKRHTWMDKYRFITAFSVSKDTFKEIALNNIAFCYGQLGDGAKALYYYKQTLAENPENGMALASIRFLQAANSLEHPLE